MSGLDPSASQASAPLRVLMICYHYPPMSTVGSLRAARFVKYMPPDIAVEVLTVADPLEPCTNTALAAEVEGRAVVHRAPLARRLAMRWAERALAPSGAGPAKRLLAKAAKTWMTWTAWIPDRAVAWVPGARRAASRLLAQRPFDVVFSTSPPPSSHLLAAQLARRHGLPLVVDFRDPWTDNPEGRWPTPLHRALEARLERRLLRSADVVLVNTAGNRRRLLEASPEVDPAAVHVLTNGFDPARRPASAGRPKERAPGAPLTLLYAGHLYDGSENGLRALARVAQRRPELVRRVRLRAIGSLDLGMRAVAEPLARAGLIELLDPVPADRVPDELAKADALLYIVPPHGPRWVPSKLYEYLASEKPIVAVLPRGDAWDILDSSGVGLLLEDAGDVAALADGLERVLERLVQGEVHVAPSREVIARYDGRELTLRFAELLRSACDRPLGSAGAPGGGRVASDRRTHERVSPG